jgi:protein-tyrosine phosphatase
MTQTTTTRELSLQVAHNVRHLGGYATASGATTGESLVRSGSLHRLTDAGVATLADTGVRTIVDLRSAVERERDITPEVERFGIVRVNAPVFEQDASPVGLSQEFAGFATVYPRFLDTGAAAYRTLFQTIADSDGGVLFHCAAGKDRTGVAAALLLGLAGVDDDTIVADFTVSETLLAPLLSEWLPKMAERGLSEDGARAIMASKAPDMRATLEHIRARYGSAEGYLHEIGLPESVTSAVRARTLA